MDTKALKQVKKALDADYSPEIMVLGTACRVDWDSCNTVFIEAIPRLWYVTNHSEIYDDTPVIKVACILAARSIYAYLAGC